MSNTNEFDFSNWRKGLVLQENDNKGISYPYIFRNISNECIEVTDSEENITCITPGEYLYATEDMALTSLNAIGGYCSNAHIEGMHIVMEAA